MAIAAFHMMWFSTPSIFFAKKNNYNGLV